jgi:hypothetical protein
MGVNLQNLASIPMHRNKRLHIVLPANCLTIFTMGAKLLTTIPARPINDAQIGGLLVSGGLK